MVPTGRAVTVADAVAAIRSPLEVTVDLATFEVSLPT